MLCKQSPEVVGKITGWVHIYTAGAPPREHQDEIGTLEELERTRHRIDSGFIYTRIQGPHGQERQQDEFRVAVGTEVICLICSDCRMGLWFPRPSSEEAWPRCYKCDDL